MKLTEEQKKLGAGGAFVLLLLFLGYRVYDSFFNDNGPPPPQAAVVVQSGPVRPVSGSVVGMPPGTAVKGLSAEKVGTTSGQLDPTLHMEAMGVTESLVYTGSGRNIFAAGAAEAPVRIAVVKPIAPARPFIASGPPPPPPLPPTCPPACPPINLKFFGTSTSASGVRKAFLLQGDDVFLAAVGDVVQRKYKVTSISANSIVIEDLPNNNKQSLPMVMN